MPKIPEIIKLTARKLRNNMTWAEKVLWIHINKQFLNVKFLRQKPIFVYTENSWLDRFIIADFYCHSKKIIIEVDGSIHDNPKILKLDLHKEKLLNNIWIKVIRIKNDEIFENINNVLEKIKSKL
jgi:very-short-patch-repair endonuclease